MDVPVEKRRRSALRQLCAQETFPHSNCDEIDLISAPAAWAYGAEGFGERRARRAAARRLRARQGEPYELAMPALKKEIPP